VLVIPNPNSPLTVITASGGSAVGDSTYTSTAGTVAPTNGAIIQGNVGIGKKIPLAPLHVGGGVPINWTGSTRSYFLPNSTSLTFDSTTSGADNPVSAIFDLKVYGIAFIADAGTYTASDTRLKHIIGRSNSAKDLETLKQIEVTDYTMKDTMRYGNRPLKRVIAQQVDCVYPTAVKPIGTQVRTSRLVRVNPIQL
jgi:Chaperone of endosialidase